ncbi:MAG: ABC transporter ATP-binding protein [Xanthobacteraceae bacterium]
MQPIIEVENLSKRYRLGQFNARSLREEFERLFRRGNGVADEREFWALRDVSFTVARGEVVGIIGRNGAGKSTLLKILSRVTEPTGGFARIRGRVASLLEVGTGFHPELTGRENIYLNGAILGMTRAEIKKKFDEIVDFSGVEKFIDTPVKRYSSGMYVRLAFAVAAHLEPEVLIVDEVLAVGDAEFQKKCLGKMRGVAKEGRTILFVSHNLGAVGNLCKRTILVQEGNIVCDGASNEVIGDYLSSVSPSPAVGNWGNRSGNGDIEFVSLEFLDAYSGDATARIKSGQSILLRVGYRAGNEAALKRHLLLGVSFFDMNGSFKFAVNNSVVNFPLFVSETGKSECAIEKFPLSPGQYLVGLYGEVQGQTSDWVPNARQIEVHEGDFYGTGRLPKWGEQGVLIEFCWKS